MTRQQLEQQYKRGNVDRFNIFYGPEYALMKVCLGEIHLVTHADIVYKDTVADAVASMRAPSFIIKSKCFVVRDDKDFLKNEKAWGGLSVLARKSNDFLVLQFSALDKRSRFYKRFQEQLVYFGTPLPQELLDRIQVMIPLDASHAEKLAHVCCNDYGLIVNELKKIIDYTKAKCLEDDAYVLDFNQSFDLLLSRGCIGKTNPSELLFELVDALLLRDKNLSVKCLSTFLSHGESGLAALALLYNRFKDVLMLQNMGKNPINIAERTGMTSWQIKNAYNKLNHYSIKELQDALITIMHAENAVKISGTMDEKTALSYVVVNIL